MQTSGRHEQVVRKRKLADAVIDHFLERLRAGDFRAGQRLPPEPELSKEFGVSRGTLREATLELSRMGYLEVRQGSGTFVAEPDARALARPFRTLLLDAPRLAGELLQFRRLIEPETARLAAKMATKSDARLLMVILDRQETAARKSLQIRRDDVDFHHEIARIADNSLVLEILDLMRQALEVYRYEGDPWTTIGQHRAIAEAIAAGDGEGARSAMVAHLEWIMRDADQQVWEAAERRA